MNQEEHSADPPTQIPTQFPHSRYSNRETVCTQRPVNPELLPTTTFGDSLRSKEPNLVRISTYNPNGITASQLALPFAVAHKHGVQIQGISETNLDLQQFPLLRKVQNEIRKLDNKSRVFHSTTSIPQNRFYKPGGTLMAVFGKLAGRVVDHGSDDLGRWTYITLEGSRCHLHIINIYQCCTRPSNPDGNSAYCQQEALLALRGDDDINPRRQFLRDLRKIIKKLDPMVNEILLMGDFNEENQGTSNVSKILEEFNMVDLWQHRHPDADDFATYQRGSSRIDHMLATPIFAEHVRTMTYEPFQFRIKGDHRGITIDVDIKSMISFKNSNGPLYHERRLHSKHFRNGTIYLRALYKHAKNQTILERLCDLQKKGTRDPEQIEKIDAQMTRGMLASENLCRKPHYDWWSVPIQTARTQLSLLSQYQSRKRRALSTQTLIDTMSQLDIMIPEDVPGKLAELRRTIAEMRKTSLEQREQWTLDQLGIPNTIDEAGRNKILKRQREKEKTANMFRMFAHHRGKLLNTKPLDRLDIPADWPDVDDPNAETTTLSNPKLTPSGEASWRRVTMPKEIEFYLLLRNRQHFGQAHGTPFTVPPLSAELNWSASTGTADLVLQGDYKNDDIDQVTQLLIDNLTRVTDLDDITEEVFLPEITKRFNRWREATTTSPSGRHLGHYKTIFGTIDPRLDQDEHEELEQMQAYLQQIILMTINYAISHRCSLNRWQQIHTQMIYKEQGNCKIHRLRVIHLYEADLNMLLGLKWKQGVHRSLQLNALPQEQYGGVPGRDAPTVALFEELRYEYVHLRRTSVAHFDNDATSCYDRIVPAVASIAGRKHGIHKNVVFVHAQTLQAARYQLKTAVGVSEAFYSNCTAFPIYGTGQGSGNSPMVWVFISAALFETHSQHSYGAIFQSVDQQTVVRISMIGFVDDSTGCTNLPAHDTDDLTTANLLHRMQQDAQLWLDLLRSSGGDLELPKCSFHLLQYDFEPSGKPVVRPTNPDPIILSAGSANVTVTSKSAFQPHKILGHYKSPNGNNQTQFETLLAKGKQLRRALQQSTATRDQAYRYYNSIYRPSLEYVVAQTTLTDDQLDTIDTQCMSGIFSKCGYNSNTARAILYGPIDQGGGGFVRLRNAKGAGQLVHLLKFIRTSHSTVGRMFTLLLGWLQLSAGIEHPVLAAHAIIPHLEGVWFCQLAAFLHKTKLSLRYEPGYRMRPRRIHDRAIMDYLMAIGTDPNTLRLCNYCRLYLGATLLSDLCTTSGTHMITALLRGKMTDRHFIPTISFPRQKKPSHATWKKFRVKMMNLCNVDGKLSIPLGMWTDDHSAHGTWPSYHDPVSDTIYRRTSGPQWDRYQSHGRTYLLQTREGWQPQQSSTSVPQPVTTLGTHRITLIQRIPIQSSLSLTDFPATPWDNFLSQQPEWQQALLGPLHFHVPLSEFHANIAQGSAQCAVSDGSLLEGRMSYGWIFADMTGRHLLHGANLTNGSPSSHRAEAGGLGSLSTFLQLYHSFTALQFPTLALYSDNLGLIQRVNARRAFSRPYPNLSLKPDYDLVEAIVNMTTQFGVSFHHVLGHQDKYKAYDDLTIPERLNVAADKLANIARESPGAAPQVPLTPYCPIHLQRSHQTITSHYMTEILATASTAEYHAYLCDRFGWEPSVISTIAWDISASALRNSGLPRPFLVKLSNNILPLNAFQYKIKQHHTPLCSLCQCSETFAHMCRCPSATRVEWRRHLLAQIRELLEDSSYSLSHTVTHNLDLWFRQSPLAIPTQPERLHKVLHAQSTIGWDNFLRGRIATEWTTAYPTQAHSKSTWKTKLVPLLHTHLQALWTMRNSEEKGTTQAAYDANMRKSLTATVLDLHARRHQAREADQTLFLQDPAAFCRDSKLDKLHRWVLTRRPAILSSFHRAHDETLKGMHPLTYYFPTTSQDPPLDQCRFDAFAQKKKRRRKRKLKLPISVTRFFPSLLSTL